MLRERVFQKISTEYVSSPKRSNLVKKTFNSVKYSISLLQNPCQYNVLHDNVIAFKSAAINAGLAGCCAGLATSFPGIHFSNNL